MLAARGLLAAEDDAVSQLRVIIVNGTTTEYTDPAAAAEAVLRELPAAVLNWLKLDGIRREQQRRTLWDRVPAGPPGSNELKSISHVTE